MKSLHWRYGSFFLAGAISYLFFSYFNQPVDITDCGLCDAQFYLKVYRFFEHGEVSQIKFPFYNRPFVPWLASLVPGADPRVSFHLVNGCFMILSLYAIRKLWLILEIKESFQWIGLLWLLLHWMGMVRHNLYDFATVDVPLYFFQPIALALFYKKNYRWFYLLTPVALLQKESFLIIPLTLLLTHCIIYKNIWWKEGKHLMFALLAGIAIQKVVLFLMPSQQDQRSSLLAILYHGKWALEDPTRFIRWFAAFGSSFGVLILLVFFKIKGYWKRQNINLLPLLLLGAAYCAFGILAGEDMTRILYLGFPFIMTMILIAMHETSKRVLLSALLLSLISLRFFPFSISEIRSVDYAPLTYVYDWAAYYLIASLVVVGIFFTRRL